MSKVILKKAGAAATESLISQMMPRIEQQLAAIRTDIHDLDGRIENLRQDVNDKFERTLETINELAHRVTRVEGKLDAYVDLVRQQVSSNQDLIERIVRLEMTKPSRRRRAG